jgi:hypothetical protein
MINKALNQVAPPRSLPRRFSSLAAQLAGLAASLFLSTALAQTPLTTSQLEAQLNATIYPNGVGTITAATLYPLLLNMIVSASNAGFSPSAAAALQLPTYATAPQTGALLTGHDIGGNGVPAALLNSIGAANGFPVLNGSGLIPGTEQTYGTTANTAAQGNDSRIVASAAAAIAAPISSANYGTVSDANSVTGNTSITSGTNTLTVTGASFQVADIGKAIVVAGAGVAGAPLLTTISGRSSTTQITLASNAATTLSAVSTTIYYGTDNTTALNNWLTACAAGNGPCYLAAGYYVITGNLSVTTPSGLKITGAGPMASQLYELNYTSGTYAINVNTNSAIIIEDLGINSLNGNLTGVLNYGIYITGPTENLKSSVRNLYLNGFHVQVATGAAGWLVIKDNVMINFYQGLFLQDTYNTLSGGYFVSNNNMTCNSVARANSLAAVYIYSGGNLQMVNNMVNYCAYGVYAAPPAGVLLGDLYFSNNSLEQMSLWGYYFNASAAGSQINSITIHGGDVGGAAVNGISLGTSATDNITDVVISGVNIFPNSSGGAAYGIYVWNAVNGVSVTGNTFANGGGTTSTGLQIITGASGVSGLNYFRGLTGGANNKYVNGSANWTVNAVP